MKLWLIWCWMILILDFFCSWLLILVVWRCFMLFVRIWRFLIVWLDIFLFWYLIFRLWWWCLVLEIWFFMIIWFSVFLNVGLISLVSLLIGNDVFWLRNSWYMYLEMLFICVMFMWRWLFDWKMRIGWIGLKLKWCNWLIWICMIYFWKMFGNVWNCVSCKRNMLWFLFLWWCGVKIRCRFWINCVDVFWKMMLFRKFLIRSCNWKRFLIVCGLYLRDLFVWNMWMDWWMLFVLWLKIFLFMC